MATKREDGEDFPAEAFAYVPDEESPSTWKLRLWDSLEERETAAQVARAVQALQPSGFRGNRVQIPTDDLPGVKRRVLAAWLRVNEDSSREDAPAVLKQYGYEEKDDDEYGDGAVDPLDELLDAYQSFVRRGMAEFADETMTLVHELQSVMLGQQRDTAKGHGMGYSNPVACLSQAYLALVMFPDTRGLASRVLALMDRAAAAMIPSGGGENENGGEAASGGSEYSGSGHDERGSVRRMVVEEDGQFCVYSESGRAFGCYADRDTAAARLAQIEQFASATLGKATVLELVELHEQAHKVDVVTAAVKDVHDLVEDELEVVHGLSQPYTLSFDDKLAMVEQADAHVLSKAAEYRYTLGPAYVPGREDAHGEFTDSATLQQAMWDWVRKGDRTIYLQHSDKAAGEMVELMTVPFPLEAQLSVPGQGVTKYTFPPDTPFLGVVWEPWAWELVKSGQLRGYSIGGSARRVEADLPDAALV